MEQIPTNHDISPGDQENLDTSMEIKKHEIRRKADSIKGRVDALMSNLDTVDPKMLELVEQMIISAYNSFDEIASTDEWQDALRGNAAK